MAKAQVASLLAALTCCAFAIKGLQADPASGGSGKPFWDLYDMFTDWQHTHPDQTGGSVEMSLDNSSVAAFGSKDSYYYGRISVKLKLSCENTSGTVTSFYASSGAPYQDEFDFEFLGNASGEPYILQTNIFVNGTGNREMRTTLWFDPCLAYHEYYIFWNKYMTLFYVDSVPIRVFMNYRDTEGIPYFSKPVRAYGTLWNADSWATEGGRIKIDWNNAPFQAWFSGFDGMDACTVWSTNGDTSPCEWPSQPQWFQGTAFQSLTQNQKNLLNWVATNQTIYNYCTDTQRFNKTLSGMPAECAPNLIPYP